MESLRDQVVEITGASSGFGKGAALRFAEEGANLVLAARRKSLLKELAKGCEKLGVKTVVVETDVSNSDDMEDLAQKAVDEFGRIDVWVNNAGVSTFGRFDEIPLKEHEQVIETNLLGCVYGSYEALRRFRAQGEGVLINVASYLGKGSAPYQSSYVASKHGIVGFTKATAVEVAEEGIRANAICPGFVHTPLVQKQIEDRAREAGVSLEKATRDIILAPVPTKEFVTVEQIAAAALFLASDGGAQMNGTTFVIDGGWTAR